MNELINELVDAIKQDQRYIRFINASKTLQEESVFQLLSDYQTVLNDLNYLKQFDFFIDNSHKKNELKKIKKEETKQYYINLLKETGIKLVILGLLLTVLIISMMSSFKDLAQIFGN